MGGTMAEKTDSFVFYNSFREAIRRVPDNMRLQVYDDFFDVCLGYKSIDDVGFPSDTILCSCLPVIEAAKRRYNKAVEDGAKGGRPSKWIDKDEAEQIYKEAGSWNAVAEKLNVDIKTLQKARFSWYGKNGKNPNVNVNENDNVNVNSQLTNNNGTDAASALTAGGPDAEEKGAKRIPVRFPDGDLRVVSVPTDKEFFVYFIKSGDSYWSKVYDSPHERAPADAANNPKFYYDADQKVWVDNESGEIIEAISKEECPSIYD